MAKIKSVLVEDMNTCYACGIEQNDYVQVECHHVFFGSYQKTWCTKRKLYLPLCGNCHRGNNSPHMNRDIDLEYRQMAQQYYEENIGDRNQFMAEFGRNYLEA